MNENKALGVVESGEFTPYLLDENGKRLSSDEAFRKAAKDLVSFHDKAKIALAEVLYTINDNEYWKDWINDETGNQYDNFQEYVESPELDFQYRQARYLIVIWDALVKQRGIPVDVLRSKSWSKLKEIARIAKEEAIETSDILALIEDSTKLTVEEVTYRAHKLRTKAIADGKKIEKIVRITFNLFEEQAENLKTALELSTAISASEKSGANLDYICTSFIAGHIHGDKREEIKRLVKELEGAAGVKVLVADDDGVIYSNKEFKDKK